MWGSGRGGACPVPHSTVASGPLEFLPRPGRRVADAQGTWHRPRLRMGSGGGLSGGGHSALPRAARRGPAHTCPQIRAPVGAWEGRMPSPRGTRLRAKSSKHQRVTRSVPWEGRHSAFPKRRQALVSWQVFGSAPNGAPGKAECLPSKGVHRQVRQTAWEGRMPSLQGPSIGRSNRLPGKAKGGVVRVRLPNDKSAAKCVTFRNLSCRLGDETPCERRTSPPVSLRS